MDNNLQLNFKLLQRNRTMKFILYSVFNQLKSILVWKKTTVPSLRSVKSFKNIIYIAHWSELITSYDIQRKIERR